MKIGHTGITWTDLEEGYRDTAELGYMSFETFARTIVEWNGRTGGYRALVDRYGIPTSAAYCYKEWIDPATAERDIDEARREADASREIGACALVLQGGSRPAGGHDRDGLQRLAAALDRIGAYCREIGLVAALHPHTGTAIETRAEIDTIMEFTDPALVGFAPDTGQIAKGGSDILEVLRTYRDRIEHVHLKDWIGRIERDADGKEIDLTGYAGYEAVGAGALPMPEILGILETIPEHIWVNVELDGTSHSPRPPHEAAAMSRNYLGAQLGDRVAWTR
ncbi:MAG TPA: sugar phosphate isomerase/epimerase [Thermomicrobiales bacterium]|nr:sugar phosphate isomerase/epimerase [Thermomicrobiales bacterium]